MRFLCYCALGMLALPLCGAEMKIGPGSLDGWGPANVRTDATIAITNTESRSGNGSLEISFNTVTPGQDKADFEKTWLPDINMTLGTLDELSYEYFRDSSSTTGANFHPVLRLYVYHDPGTPMNTLDDTLALLIFEEVYQPGFSVPVDTWDINDLMSARFWMFVIAGPGGSGVVQNFGLTLADWEANTDPVTMMPPVGLPGDPVPPALNANSAITGINVGVGSGWGNTFLGFVDNITLGFSGTSTTYNFESPVPVELQSFTIE